MNVPFELNLELIADRTAVSIHIGISVADNFQFQCLQTKTLAGDLKLIIFTQSGFILYLPGLLQTVKFSVSSFSRCLEGGKETV